MKTIKIIVLVTLLASTLPMTSNAWGKKKKKDIDPPEDAWSILLGTNAPATSNSPSPKVADGSLNEAEGPSDEAKTPFSTTREPAQKHKTAPEQFATAHSLLANADKARANKDFVSAIELYDKAVRAYFTLGNEYPDWQPAVMKFRRNHCEYHLKVLLRQADKGEIKLDTFATPQKKKPSQQKKASALTKAKQLLMQNKNEEARDLLIKTLMTYPDNTRIRLMIGIVQCRLKQYHDATYLLETLIEEHPGDANAHVILATAYFGINRNDDVIAQLNKALEIDSFHKEANFNMAKILLKTKPDNTEAIAKYYIKAVELGIARDPKLDAAILK